jgi:hypothetical protein
MLVDSGDKESLTPFVIISIIIIIFIIFIAFDNWNQTSLHPFFMLGMGKVPT